MEENIVVLSAGAHRTVDLELLIEGCEYSPRYETDEIEGMEACVITRSTGCIFNFIRLSSGRCFLDFSKIFEPATVRIDGHSIQIGVPNDMYLPPDDRRTFTDRYDDGEAFEREIVYSYELMPAAYLVGTGMYLSQLPSKDILNYDFNKSTITLDKTARTMTLSIEDLVVAIVDYSGIVIKTYPNWALFDIEDIHFAVFQGVPQTWLYSSLSSPHTDEQILLL